MVKFFSVLFWEEEDIFEKSSIGEVVFVWTLTRDKKRTFFKDFLDEGTGLRNTILIILVKSFVVSRTRT